MRLALGWVHVCRLVVLCQQSSTTAFLDTDHADLQLIPAVLLLFGSCMLCSHTQLGLTYGFSALVGDATWWHETRGHFSPQCLSQIG